MIESARFQSPIGSLSILAVREGVVKIAFANESREEMQQWCQKHLGMEVIKGTAFSTEAKCQILDYLSGMRKSLNFPILHHNTTFRKIILEEQRKIPYGETRSYAEVAQMVGSPQGSRAVGLANADNPLPYILSMSSDNSFKW